MDSDQPIHATMVDGSCVSLVWRPNGKPTDDEGVDAARKSADNFILVWWVYQRTGCRRSARTFPYYYYIIIWVKQRIGIVKKKILIEKWFSGLILDWRICVHILIFFSMNVFFSRKKNEHNMNIGEYGSKQASTFVREFILVYFFLNLCSSIKLWMRIPWDWRNQEGISFFPRQEIWTRRKGSNFAFFMSFSLYSGFEDGPVVIWTPLAKEKTRILRQHSGYVESVSFSPDGRFLASAGRHGKLIIWSTEVNKKTEPIKMVWYLVAIQYWIYSTLFQNWEPVFIEEGDITWVERFSWLSSSTDVPDYKLAFDSYNDKV